MKQRRIQFPISGYDPKRAYSTASDDGFAFASLDLPGGRYLLRNAFKMTLFRRADANHDDWTFFAYRDAPKKAVLLSEWLADVIEKRQFGRYLHWSPLKAPRSHEDRCFLFLRNEGTGRAYIDGRHFAIEWSHPEISGDVVSLQPEQADALAEYVFNKSVNLKLDDPFLTAEHRNEPIEFLCGSEEELEIITLWICHTEPGFFDGEYSDTIWFNSSSEIIKETRPDYTIGPEDTYNKFSLRMMELLQLAYEHNCFTGWYRAYQDYNDEHRFSGNYTRPAHVAVAVEAPSAHERAEAVLNLADWLKGKVPESERRSLLEQKQNNV